MPGDVLSWTARGSSSLVDATWVDATWVDTSSNTVRCGCVGGVGSGGDSLAWATTAGSGTGVGVAVAVGVCAGAAGSFPSLTATSAVTGLGRRRRRTPRTVRSSSCVDTSSPLAAVVSIRAVVRSISDLLDKNSNSEPWLFHSTSSRWISSSVSPRLCSRNSRRIGSMSRDSLMTGPSSDAVTEIWEVLN